jgi:hypothetical protein
MQQVSRKPTYVASEALRVISVALTATGTCAGRIAPGECRGDPIGGLDGVLVLPHSDDSPAGVGKAPVGVSIALAIPLDLRAPPLGIRRGPRHVQRAAMPEAAIDKDCYPRPAEHQVGPPT